MSIVNYYLNYIKYFVLGFDIRTNYLQAIAVSVLLFLLVLTLASVRKHFVHWSMKGGLMGLFFGVLLTVIVEGLLLVSGHTFLTSVLGWKNPPKPFSTALDIGKQKLTNVLGVSSDNPSVEDAINVIQTLDPNETAKIKGIICTP